MPSRSEGFLPLDFALPFLTGDDSDCEASDSNCVGECGGDFSGGSRKLCGGGIIGKRYLIKMILVNGGCREYDVGFPYFLYEGVGFAGIEKNGRGIEKNGQAIEIIGRGIEMIGQMVVLWVMGRSS
nr:hypothetical protein [Tanacetum cinerariifolium]